MQLCSQCRQRQAMFDFSGHLLCLDCRNSYMASLQGNVAADFAMMNHLTDQIEDIMGVPSHMRGPRIQIPQPTVQYNPVTYNNIQVDRSVVGAINTAQVARIDVAMENIKNSGNDEVNEALKALTEAVVSSTKVQDKTRTQLVEQLAFLAEQAALPPAQQQKSVIKMVLKAIPVTIAAAADLTALWSHWGGTLTSFFK